ncbi:MAG: chromosome partitioning protein [Solirubrobacterales bacterium]|jgi:chromosome partitioning protein|nr:chromosome partitioning protein [Solirubrobacterales bacterium]
MGLFNRASRHSGGNGGGLGPATAGRESTHDADLGAELAELGELVPERKEPEAESPATDVVEELEAAEESGSAEVEGPSAVPGSDAAEADEPAADEVPGTSVAAVSPADVVESPSPDTVVEDPDADRINFEDALSPRRGAISAGTPNLEGAENERPVGTAKVMSFANQKGGVAKTTTTLNLAVALAEMGHRVLCIDLDPQGNLTMSQGIDPDKVEKSMYDVLVHHIPLTDVIQKREIDIAVASIDLAGAEIAMSTQIGRERSLEKAIRGVENDYDFVCIDTPPSLGLLTVNALTASNSVVVPVQCEYLSMRGLMQLQNTLEMIRENLNPKVQVEGILPTMLDSRTVHAKEAVELLEENFGDLVFKTRIRKAIKFAEAPVRGASVLKYDPQSNAADYYRELAKEVLAHGAT